MYIEIVTPEAILYRGKISEATLPSTKGEFQILNSHAPIIALLSKGDVRLTPSADAEIFVEQRFEKRQKGQIVLHINSGIVEQKENHIIVLAE